MITILIADDEKLERNGIKFLLKREQEELEILEAINGKDAAGILQKKQVDILFSDIKMPYMTGLELAKAARELQPEIEIVIFSGYNDFSYAKEALHYGVVDYVLKPVDPGEFHKTYCSVRDHILEKNTQKGEIARQQDDLGKYFLQNFLYDGKEENGTKAAELLCQDGGQYTHMILAGGEDCFFEVDEEKLLGQLREHMSRQFLYLNVAANESLFLFQERYADYETVAKELYQFFKNKYDEECYLAVSEEITDWQELPEVFSGLEEVLAEKFYQPRQKIFFAGEVQETREMDEAEESQVLNNIKEDIQYKDSIHLRQDFQKLERKYRESMKFSEMYVKFVFSNIVKDIYEEINPGDVKALSKMIDRLYRCRKIEDVLAITEQVVCELEKFVQEQNKGFRNEVMKVKQYIHHHYAENLNVENLARQVYLSPGYLSVVFKEETGVNLNRYVRDIRMKKSRELLENTSMKISQIAKEVGFSNNSYFCRSFREYFGSTPEYCRKSQCRESGKASLSLPGIFKCCIQGGDRSQSEPLCPGYPDEEIQGASGKYQYEDLTDRKRGWIFQ